MTKSALQIARAAYQPKLPKALASGAVKAVADAALHLLPDTDAVVGFAFEYIFCLCEEHYNFILSLLRFFRCAIEHQV